MTFEERLRGMLEKPNPVEARIEAGLLLWEYAPAILALVEAARTIADDRTSEYKAHRLAQEALRALDEGSER